MTGKSLLMFISADNGMIHFDSGIILDTTIQLDKKIKIGITKREFVKRLGAPETTYGDVIKITDQDNGYDHIFFFHNDILKGIKLENTYTH